jgi:hypothetical protein
MRDRNLISVFTCGYSVFLAPFVEKAVFSPTYVFHTFVKNQMAVASWVYFWFLCSILFVDVYVWGQYHSDFATIDL